ncbi:MAG: nicotinate phosphoribosyltransferase [Methanobacteriota archaeon]
MSSALLTDLYELTMAQSLLEHGKTGRAVFSVTIRTLPPERNFLVSCGLESLIKQLTSFTFTREEISYLRKQQRFSESFLTWLSTFRFTGDIIAVPEGRIVFENEPLIRIEGCLPEIQVLETIALNLIHHQTVIASKAARMIAVAGEHRLIDFGLRRAHGPECGTLAARAAYITGFAGTSNLEAGRLFGVPISGTMAHSYILVHGTEEEAFRAYISTFPHEPVLLIDTYDILTGAEIAARLAREGLPLSGVRIDSGDMTQTIPVVRKILDDQDLRHVKIIVSGGVDEHDIDRWTRAGLPIDAYGVGTRLLTSADIPYLDMTYKLVEYEGTPRLKTSPGKITIPGRRDIYRHYRSGLMSYDEVVLVGEACDGELLTEIVMLNGVQIRPSPSLEEIRGCFRHDFNRLPPRLKGLGMERFHVNIR